jgi:hypothetical protein
VQGAPDRLGSGDLDDLLQRPGRCVRGPGLLVIGVAEAGRDLTVSRHGQAALLQQTRASSRAAAAGSVAPVTEAGGTRYHASDDPRTRAAICSAEAQRGGIPSDQAVRCARRALRLAQQADDPLLVSAALDGLMAAAQTAADQHPIAAALAHRAAALQQGDRMAVLATASAFARAGYPYQQARSQALAERIPA